MNKKIASELAIGIILILAIAIGGIFWLQSNRQLQVQQSILAKPVMQTQQIEKTTETDNLCLELRNEPSCVEDECWFICSNFKGENLNATGSICKDKDMSLCEEKKNKDRESGKDERVCVTEPGESNFPPAQKCCNGLKSIFGEDVTPCTLNESLAGASTCAPCGNNICEPKFRENKCSCPEDCK